MSAIAAVMFGVAIEVPERGSYPLGFEYKADTMLSAGDTSCGFLRPSVVGPRELTV